MKYYRWFIILPGILLIIGVILGIIFSPGPEEVGTTSEAQQAKELISEVTLDLPVKSIQVYQPAVKKKLKLPKAVIKDDNQHVVASSKIKGDDHPRTVTTVVDTDTGEFDTYTRKDPLPWVSVNTRTHIGAYYGIKDGEQIVRIQAQQEILQIKALRLEAVASTDIGGQDTTTFVGIGGRISF